MNSKDECEHDWSDGTVYRDSGAKPCNKCGKGLMSNGTIIDPLGDERRALLASNLLFIALLIFACVIMPILTYAASR